MRILSWNVNGIRAACRKGFNEWLENDSPDILCLQETKAHPGQISPEMLRAEGYRTYWNDPPRKGYAGVAVFTKPEPVKVESDFSRGDLDTEGRALILKYPRFMLVNVYFPNGGSGPERLGYKLDFYDKFLEWLDSLEEKRILLCGDLNTAHKEIDLARPKQNRMVSGFLPEEREWMDRLVEHGFIDTFRRFVTEPGQYSWWDYKTRSRERNVGWRIDYFFANKAMMRDIRDAFILSGVTGSDHCPVGVETRQGLS